MLRRALALTAILAACAGCGKEDPVEPGTSVQPGMHEPKASSCGEREDIYVAGLEKTGGDLKVRILSADPAPPARGINHWTLSIEDASGQAMTSAEIKVTPYMPDHGHGTSVTPTVRPGASGGYEIDNVYLFMPGLWQTTLSITPAGATAPTQVVYSFCIDG